MSNKCYVCKNQNKLNYICNGCKNDICIDCLSKMKFLTEVDNKIMIDYKCCFCRNINNIQSIDNIDILYILQKELKDMLYYKKQYQIFKNKNKILENQIEEMYLENTFNKNKYDLGKFCLET